MMSYPPLGYSYSAQAPLNIPTQLLTPGSTTLTLDPTTTPEVLSPTTTTSSAPSPATPNTHLTDTSSATPTGISPTTPQPAHADPASLTIPQTGVYSAGVLKYPPRLAGLTDTMSTLYNTAYATQGYVPFGGDPSAFYSPLTGNNTEAWRNLSTGGAWPYDPTMAAYPYSAGYGGLDVRRKNATREATSTLKAWLYEHIKNPYPTKGEKIMLAIITKMTLTQVSTWFANARRRLKKENKMQWSPRNRTGDEDDDDKDGSDDEGEGEKRSRDQDKDEDDEDIIVDGCGGSDGLRLSSPGDRSEDGSLLDLRETNALSIHGLTGPQQSTESNAFLSTPNGRDGLLIRDHLFMASMNSHHQHQHQQKGGGDGTELPSSPLTSSSTSSHNNSNTNNKPRIWSMADMATASEPAGQQLNARSTTAIAQPASHQSHTGSPTAIAQSLINKSGYTAFTTPPINNNTSSGNNNTLHPHHPQLGSQPHHTGPNSHTAVFNGSYHGLGQSSNATGLSPYRLGGYLPGTTNTHTMTALPNFHRPATINALATASGSCGGQRINTGVLVGSANLEGARLANISASSLDNTATAFKPVARRS